MSNLFRKLQLRFPFSHRYPPPVAKRLRKHEIVDRAIADILTVVTLDLSRLRRYRNQFLADQLTRLLIKANNWSFWIERSFVNVEHIFHCGDKISVLFGRNHPHFLEMRLKFVFFRTLRTVSCEVFSTMSSSTH